MATVLKLKAGPPNIPEIDDCNWNDWTFDPKSALGYWYEDLWYVDDSYQNIWARLHCSFP